MSTYKEILKHYWGYDDFRGIQQQIIESIGLGHDTLGLMPTGGGKSLTFQVPGLALEGVCIVVTPLIALMKDQVQHLRQRGILAAAIFSGMSHDDILRVLENCILGRTKFLYVSPERLSSEFFVSKLRHIRVSFITVDEAHCISQWGYDFRPSYLEIANIRTLLPNVPILALTATATPKVVDDICERLSLPKANNQKQTSDSTENGFHVFRMSFERKNLTYSVKTATDKLQELVHTLSNTTGSAIVYVRSRRRAKEIAEELTKRGLSATFYHAGLEHEVKDQRQRDWQQDRTRIIVATNAFGMGIDKPDVRLVMHYDCPDSIEAYFQEAGRAGRDGKSAQAIMLYNNSDNAKLTKRIDDTFPPKDEVREVYEHLAYFFQIATGDGFGITREFNIDVFCQRFHHFPIRVHSALQILQRAGYLEYDPAPDQQTRVRFLLERQTLYQLENLSEQEDRLIVALLRNYGGLFADFGYIDEALIAQHSGLRPVTLHEVLKSLAHKHIRCQPSITCNDAKIRNTSSCLPTSTNNDMSNIASASSLCSTICRTTCIVDRACYSNTLVKRTPMIADSVTSACSKRKAKRLRFLANSKFSNCSAMVNAICLANSTCYLCLQTPLTWPFANYLLKSRYLWKTASSE